MALFKSGVSCINGIVTTIAQSVFILCQVLFSDCRKPRDEYVYEIQLLDLGIKGT